MGEIFGQGQNLRPKFLTREIDNEIPFHSTKQEKEKRKYINSPNLNAEYLKIVSLKYPPQKKKKKKKKKVQRDLWIDTEFSVKKIIESVPWRAC